MGKVGGLGAVLCGIVLCVVGGCSSAPSEREASAPRLRVTGVRVERSAGMDVLEVAAVVNGGDRSFAQVYSAPLRAATAPDEDGPVAHHVALERKGEWNDEGGADRARVLVSSEPLEKLALGSSVEELDASGRITGATRPLVEADLRDAVLVHLRCGPDSFVANVALPRGGARAVGIEELPLLEQSVVFVATSPRELARPPEPSPGTHGVILAEGVATVFGGLFKVIGGTVVFALAVATLPLWLPFAAVVFSGFKLGPVRC